MLIDVLPNTTISADEERKPETSPFDALKSESVETMSWSGVTDCLMDIRNLHNDWDGMGAPAPGKDLVDLCFTLNRHLRSDGRMPPPTIVRPTPDGNVAFEWQADSLRIELELTQESLDITWAGLGRPPKFESIPFE